MDIGSWLRSLGLERYEATFRENEIDETIVHDLTGDHLRELGFPLGARLKLLKAIAALNAGESATDSSANVAPEAPLASASAPSPRERPIAVASGALAVVAGERRHITVMFCDLVD